MHKYIFLLLLGIPHGIFAQASFIAMGTPYTQNFNTLPNTPDGGNAAWTNNTTLAGWYIDEGTGGSCGGTACDDVPTVEATYATMNNGGNSYLFASGSDRSIGSRAAGSTGTVHLGLRIVNSTGSAISSVYVDYYGEQWSIAENQANVNTIQFSYQVGASVTSLTAGAWTNVTALDFTQLYTSAQSSGMGGSACAGTSAQCLALDGNQSANRVHIQGCVTVSIPAGQEIMLRWTDVNDAANDHHMQIDDVTVYPFDVSCAVVLPVEWLSFTVEQDHETAMLHWSTATETNNDYFVVERRIENGTFISLAIVDGNGTTAEVHHYSFADEVPEQGVNYYRIRQVDFDGQSGYSVIRTATFGDENAFGASIIFDGTPKFQQWDNIGATKISVFTSDGRLVMTTISDEKSGTLDAELSSGLYCIQFINRDETIVIKLLVAL